MKKLFTLIELIIVIVVLGILTVIVIPSISSMKDKAIKTAITNDIVNIQTAVDMQFTNEGELPTEVKAKLGNPQEINFDKIVPEYLRSVPKQGNFWLDDNQTVHGSMSELPFSQLSDSGLLSWDKTEGAEEYIVYEDSNKTTSNASNPLLKVVQKGGFEKNEVGRYYFEGDKNKNYYLSSVDKYGNETPVVGSNFVAISGLEVDILVREDEPRSTLYIIPEEEGLSPYKYTHNGETYTGSNLELDFFESQTVEITAHFESGDTEKMSIFIEVLQPIKNKSINFNEQVGDAQTHVIEIKDLQKVEKITSEDGDVEILSIDGEKVTIKLSNGEMTKKVQTGGEVIPADTKQVSFTTNINEEYRRFIDKGKDMGLSLFENPIEPDLETLPAGYTDYKGELKRTYIGVPYKIVDYKYTNSYPIIKSNDDIIDLYLYSNGEWVSVSRTSGGHSIRFEYDDGEYKSPAVVSYKQFGELIKTEENVQLSKTNTFDGRNESKPADIYIEESYNYRSNNGRGTCNYVKDYTSPKEGECTVAFNYDSYKYKMTGKVFKGGPEGAKWLYEGEVTRPEIDNRTYDEYYQYGVSIEYR